MKTQPIHKRRSRLTVAISPLVDGAVVSLTAGSDLVMAAAVAGGSSSSLSGCSISKLLASGSGSGVASTLGVTAGVEIGVNSSLKADFGSSFSCLGGVGVT